MAARVGSLWLLSPPVQESPSFLKGSKMFGLMVEQVGYSGRVPNSVTVLKRCGFAGMFLVWRWSCQGVDEPRPRSYPLASSLHGPLFCTSVATRQSTTRTARQRPVGLLPAQRRIRDWSGSRKTTNSEGPKKSMYASPNKSVIPNS